ncbi:MAG: glycosyltransferase family 2 protein [Planctomycetota bacterium]
MPETLTIIVPTFNEEDCIRRCLESAKFADDLFVVDSFSTDKTLEIAREFTSHIVQHEYVNSATQKNWAIPQCKTDWIMVLDADEWISEELRDEILSVLRKGSPHAGFMIKRETYFFGRLIRHGGWHREYILRLWQNGKGRYQDKHVHASVAVEGSVGRIRTPIYHDTYKSFDDYFEKFDRYTKWAAKDLFDAGKRASAVNLTLRPLWRMFNMYVINHGFMDGKHGLILALLSGYYVFVKYARLWLMQLQAGRH